MVKKIFQILLFAALLIMTAATGFSNERGGPHYLEEPGNPEGLGMQGSEHFVQHEGPGMIHGGMGILGQLAGVDTINRKYLVKIQRVFLDAKQEALNYYEEQLQLREKLFDLTRDYENNPAKNKREIVAVLEKINENQKKMQTIQEGAMEKIRALNSEHKKEIEKAVDAEIKRLSYDEDEMMKFVEIVKEGSFSQFHPPLAPKKRR